jgi:glycosyltransferase A (GT-A) superfamily protein (DUF2064 family)
MTPLARRSAPRSPMQPRPILLLVLAKAPHPGAVKTRLCPPADHMQAAEIAGAALLDTIDAVRRVPGGLPVLALAGNLSGACRGAEITAALDGVPVFAQRGATLGERIAAAHSDAAGFAPGAAVVQIGMDTPQVDAALLTTSCRALLAPGTEAVLGPALDGGWWALGLRDPGAAAAIATVPTSRTDTGAQTMAALRERGIKVSNLPELRDVDTVTDAKLVAATVPTSRFAHAVRALG